MPAKMKLSQLDLLELLASPEHRELAASFRERTYPKKALVCTPYDDLDQVFILKQGRLRVFLACDDREFTLALLEPGDIFSTHTRAFAETLEPSTLLIDTTEHFRQQLVANPGINLVMVKVLGELLKNSITIIEGLAFKDTRQRLLDFLLNAVEERGQQHPQGVILTLGLSSEELALLIGTTRQTISTLINEFIKAGCMEKQGRTALLITDLAALAAMRSGIA